MGITPGVLGDWAMEVAAYTEGAEPTAWTRVYGITEFTPPQTEKNLEDDSEFDGTYWSSQIATGIGWNGEGTLKTPRAGMAADPGQEILKSASREVLEGGFVHCRFWQVGATTGDQGVADVSFVSNGGPKTDLTTAALTLTGRGALTDFTVTAP